MSLERGPWTAWTPFEGNDFDQWQSLFKGTQQTQALDSQLGYCDLSGSSEDSLFNMRKQLCIYLNISEMLQIFCLCFCFKYWSVYDFMFMFMPMFMFMFMSPFDQNSFNRFPQISTNTHFFSLVKYKGPFTTQWKTGDPIFI